MRHYNYLIIGGGMTGDSAAQGIREIDLTGSIGIISSDSDAPYDRPPLTKGLWKGKPLESIWRDTKNQKVDLHLGRTVNALDAGGRTVTDDRHEGYHYDKLLLATGGTPRRLPFADEPIVYFRTLKDYRRLRALADKGRRFAVVGSGFIGSELAAALAMNGKEVVMVFPGSGICQRVFPPDVSNFLNDYYREKGVELLSGESVSSLDQRGEQFALKTQSGRELIVDGVVAGIGITPNVELARRAGLPIDNGIIVDEFLQTARPEIYAAGDVAAFPCQALEKRMRVEHEDNANSMGRVAGRNMAGMAGRYLHLPFFYSDLFDLGYEAVGELDSRLSVIADWKEPYREGVLYYHRDGRVRGVLLWNVWEKVDAARELITSHRPMETQEFRKALAWRA